MNRTMIARELASIARSLTGSDAWKEVLKLLETKDHLGNEEFADFCAEVWNGGVEQWVLNRHADDLHTVIDMAKRLGPKGQHLAGLLTSNRNVIGEFEKESGKRGEDANQEDYEELAEKLGTIDDWFYANDDAVVAEFLEYLKK